MKQINMNVGTSLLLQVSMNASEKKNYMQHSLVISMCRNNNNLILLNFEFVDGEPLMHNGLHIMLYQYGVVDTRVWKNIFFFFFLSGK